MAIRVALNHKTVYRYARPATLGPQVVRLRPAPHNRTPVHQYSLKIEPSDHYLNWQQDPHGNYLARIVVNEKTPVFSVEVDLILDLEAYSPFDFFLDSSAEEFPFTYEPAVGLELKPYLEVEAKGPAFERFVADLDVSRRRTVDFLVETNRKLFESVQYIIRMEPGVQTPEETLETRKGSCRDSAWLLVQVLRKLGIAARFVSGYLIQLTADKAAVDGPSGPPADFTDLHAWCECYVSGAGWIGLDPTSGLLTAEGHIPLAATPKPSTAAPIEGGVEDVETEFGFDMSVARVVDKPRVTKPYTDEQWDAILTLGENVEVDLLQQDVRLSSGGEPTFVSSEFPDNAEWNTDALGPTKEGFADRLLHRLYPMWSPGGVLFYGQGKWYPGEQLPRWAYASYFRRDGVPMWNDQKWFARSAVKYGFTAADAKRFMERLVVNLGLTQHGMMPAYEDVWYYMWRERRLPTNVNPLDSRLEDPVERARLAKVFAQGLDVVVGYALPLAHVGYWISGNWFLRREYCYLFPGDSPMGFRLPLDSVPWSAAIDQVDEPLDPSSDVAPLAKEFAFPLRRPQETTSIAYQRREVRTLDGERRALGPNERFPGERAPGERFPGERATSTANPFVAPLSGESALGITRTALCVEPRDGLLHVFLPPLQTLEAFVELIAAIEHTAQETGLPIQLEGYPPPRDRRLTDFKVTPDPGVIEVNVPPVTSWGELVKQTEELYESAYQEKLVAEKFDIDGTHIGSGGGNHMVFGAIALNDSPFLRRPDLLASLVGYWHNHPSLSFLFSGRFIGPTSQAPRVDEARNDATYELEVAFDQLPEPGRSVPPWLIDRILRNILVDSTGNTHRTEFCIDKLFSPDGPTGRLGLLEMRAFEMPPHERMSVVQQLLIRGLLATFWKQPYKKPLVKWGTALHDQFMLPYYVRRDFSDVIEDLQRWGYDFDLSWFEPHYQFRFPRYGELTLDRMRVELRGGLEPWHVLGEESGAGGQTRYVDSSLERMQIRVEGFLEERYIVLCNGYEVPLKRTGVNGQAVAGVRYRAWQPPSCLHPTIGVHSPLHVDIYDTWAERSVAGATYHVVHPGGRASDVRPVNAVAAESRRLARFEPRGHLAGRFKPRALTTLNKGDGAAVHPHFPHTLDLRWAKS